MRRNARATKRAVKTLARLASGCENIISVAPRLARRLSQALPATTNPDHLLENLAALRGPLPDKEMRARMVRHMETIPGFDKIAEMAWYPGKTFRGVINHAQQDLRKRA
jgi:aryl-alcohol dehydrogenase-like predicted oxidoreductase